MQATKVEVERGLEGDLRQTTPEAIWDYLEKNWDAQVQVNIAEPGELITVPAGWHGAGKQGEAEVLFGDVLTESMAGTALPAAVFTEWLFKQGFEFSTWDQPLSETEAAENLDSHMRSNARMPIYRAMRRAGDNRPAVQIEYFNGAQSDKVCNLSFIGNNEARTKKDEAKYRQIVSELMGDFIAKGTTKAKADMGISRNVIKTRWLDDCLAGCTTIAGDIEVSKKLGERVDNSLWVIDVSIATTQGIVVAMFMAEREGVPLLIRAGAPSFGLAGEEKGTNYMANISKNMRSLGYYTSGDFGQIMNGGKPVNEETRLEHRGNGGRHNQTRVFLNGGGPVLKMMDHQYARDGKPYHGEVSVRRASRIDNGPEQWGVIIKGIYH
jgi:hypothetical protein